MQVLAYAQEDSSTFIRKGVIFKLDNFEDKLARLKEFYKKGLNQVGWNLSLIHI